MKNKFFFFSFFIFLFLSLTFISSTQPNLVSVIPDLNLTNSQSVTLNLNDYVTDYDLVILDIYDTFGLTHYIGLWLNGSSFSNYSTYTSYKGVNYFLTNYNTYVNLTITTNSLFRTPMYVDYFFFNATTSMPNLISFYNVVSLNSSTVNPSPSPYVGNYPNEPIGHLVNGLLSWFPDSSNLSTATKLTYVAITIFLFFLIYYAVIYGIYGGQFDRISSFFHYIFFIFVLVLVFMFIGISYIPISVLIVSVLVLVVLAYFRFKSGFSAQG